MLDPERIPIGKLKQAFDLNRQDVETIISALWPNEVFPYALWEMAYRPRWKGAASHNTIFYKAKALSAFPEFDPLEHQLPLLHIYCDRIVYFFRELTTVIFVTDLMDGLNRIIELTYENNDNSLDSEIEYLFSGLSHIESELNFGINKPFTWAVNITHERFYEVYKSKISFIAPCTTDFISKMFIDTIVVDKTAAIRHLLKCGYPFQHEVKGISRALVDRIAATLDAHSQEDTPVAPAPFSIVVPRALWEGKSPKAARDSMKQQGFTDPRVIAYVLYNWCGLKNKTQLGKLLGPDGKDDSTYLRLAHRLLAEAATLNITTA
jgi:hypothetical protein